MFDKLRLFIKLYDITNVLNMFDMHVFNIILVHHNECRNMGRYIAFQILKNNRIFMNLNGKNGKNLLMVTPWH